MRSGTRANAGVEPGELELAAAGNLADLTPELRRGLIDRSVSADRRIIEDVASIIRRVRDTGDSALIEMAALDAMTADLRAALERAAARIGAFHRAQLPGPLEFESASGVRLTRVAEPFDRVGVYAPGGRATYPSSVLMGAVPARVAGVGEVIVCSPPDSTGSPSPAVLAACAIARVDRVFAAGGAGAIAALAYGTASVPAVRRIVGPGNAWVNEAKQQVQRVVGIDCPAGPSEVLLIADRTADPRMMAAEMVAQAEHDPEAAAILIATDPGMLDAVAGELASLVAGHAREDGIRAALSARGALLHGRLADAVSFANEYAPEHLLLAVTNAHSVRDRIRNAGTVFLGQSSSVVFGDYVTGANHVLPTGGLARSSSGLSVLDFVRWTTVQELTPAAAARLAPQAALMAEAERLPGHALAARLRLAVPTAAKAVEPAATRFGRVAYREIRTYDPGRAPVRIDLSDNTNLFGVCPAVSRAISELTDGNLTRYPSVRADTLLDAAAAHFDVAADSVVSGCGSDDVIDSTVRAFCEPGDVVAFPWPTFGIVSTFARMNAAQPVPVEQPPDAPLAIDSLLRTGARLIYLCRPNNPTGVSMPASSVLQLAESFNGVVLLDEAYAEFAGDDLLQDAVASRNIIVLRTLSKAWGMAGLRVGLAVGPAPLIAEIEKSRGPYKISAPAESAATAVLRGGHDWVDSCIHRVRANRERLSQALRGAGHDVLDSQANFVLIRLREPSRASDVAMRLRDRGVGVRAFGALPTLGDCIRVTVGPWDMMAEFLDAFLDERPSGYGRS